MPTPKQPKPLATTVEKSLAAATHQILDAMALLDQLDKFRLAAIVTWMRGQWCGDSSVLGDVDGALKLIDAMTERERRLATEMAAESNLRAAVTA